MNYAFNLRYNNKVNLHFLIFTIITYCFKKNLLIDFIMLLNIRIKD